MTLTASVYRQNEAARWQNDYHQHLRQRLNTTLNYVRNTPHPQVRAHLRSLLATLDEARRYPDLNPVTLELIAALHPLPLRWGFGYLWQSHLSFAVQQECDARQQAAYHNALAEIYFINGAFAEAIREAQAVFAAPLQEQPQTARACRTLFSCYRSMGTPEWGDRLIQEKRNAFHLDLDAHQVPVENTDGWLILNLCQLELLREQGRNKDALDLVNEMIWLDERRNAPDALLTADMVTRRSTLLWMNGFFQRAVDDILHAIELYHSAEDVFNAEGLQSNLGLVYWSMGEYKLAEKSMQAAIQFYRKSGADQLVTHDLGNLGLLYFARGQLQAALDQTRLHIAHAEKIGFVAEYNRGLRNLGIILVYFQDYEHALKVLETNEEYFAQRGLREGYMIDFVWRAYCYDQMGQKDRALRDIRKVVEWSVENEMVMMEAVSRRSLAFLLPREEKLSHLQRCMELSKRHEKQLEKAAVLLTMAQVMPQEHRQQTWQAGVDLLHKIGAEAWLQDRSIENPPYIPTLAR